MALWSTGLAVYLQKILAEAEFSISRIRKMPAEMSRARENFFELTVYAPSCTPFDSALRAASTDVMITAELRTI